MMYDLSCAMLLHVLVDRDAEYKLAAKNEVGEVLTTNSATGLTALIELRSVCCSLAISESQT